MKGQAVIDGTNVRLVRWEPNLGTISSGGEETRGANARDRIKSRIRRDDTSAVKLFGLGAPNPGSSVLYRRKCILPWSNGTRRIVRYEPH